MARPMKPDREPNLPPEARTFRDGISIIPNDAGIDQLTYSPIMQIMCSIGQDPFDVELVIQIRPNKWLLEYMSFEMYFPDHFKEPTTIEDAARRAIDVLERVLGDIPMRVTAYARSTVHAPVEARISRRWEENP